MYHYGTLPSCFQIYNPVHLHFYSKILQFLNERKKKTILQIILCTGVSSSNPGSPSMVVSTKIQNVYTLNNVGIIGFGE